MRKVAHILQRKGSNIISVAPETSVLHALEIMAEKNIGSIMVISGDQYLGLITERDYARKVILKGHSSTETRVSEIMSTGLPRITPDHSIDTCMHIMSESNIRYLPVFENDKVTGIISIIDVVTETIISQKEQIDQLHSYIHS
ncbi:MAG: CBS domain-containing protein [Chitinophagaceae bacterium]|nr:CBS domain-containing protein [Chitinophagaceae bacterium]